MIMTKEEIAFKYNMNHTDSKRENYKYCKILGELNSCGANDIIDILNEQGVENVPKKMGKSKKIDDVVEFPFTTEEIVDEYVVTVDLEELEEYDAESAKNSSIIDQIRELVGTKFEKPKTISQQLEEVAQEICEKYCKFTSNYLPGDMERMWGEHCDNCPLNRL